MQDPRALRTSTNLISWRAWEESARDRSGFTAILGSVFALTVAFVLFLSTFARTLGDDLVPISFISLIVLLGTSFSLLALAVWRVNAWKRANPWTPPS